MRAATLSLFLSGLVLLSVGQEQKQTWEGYLADQMCAFRWRGELSESYAKRHARSCNFHEECMASGYGIMVKGTFIKLTETSKPKATGYLESITKRNSVYVKITGVLVDEKIEVQTIETAERDDDR